MSSSHFNEAMFTQRVDLHPTLSLSFYNLDPINDNMCYICKHARALFDVILQEYKQSKEENIYCRLKSSTISRQLTLNFFRHADDSVQIFLHDLTLELFSLHFLYKLYGKE